MCEWHPARKKFSFLLKRTLLAFVVSVAIYTMSNFVIHAALLQPLYQRTSQLLRTPQDGAVHMPFLLLSVILAALYRKPAAQGA